MDKNGNENNYRAAYWNNQEEIHNVKFWTKFTTSVC